MSRVKIQVIQFCRHSGFDQRDHSCGHSRSRGGGGICVHGAVGSRPLDDPIVERNNLVWWIPDWCALQDAPEELQ